MQESELSRRMDRLESDMRARFLDLDHTIFGNGQPGLRDKVEALENFKWKLLGYGSAIGTMIGFLTGGGDISLKHFLGH